MHTKAAHSNTHQQLNTTHCIVTLFWLRKMHVARACTTSLASVTMVTDQDNQENLLLPVFDNTVAVVAWAIACGIVACS
jgi:hypothetical protein